MCIDPVTLFLFICFFNVVLIYAMKSQENMIFISEREDVFLLSPWEFIPSSIIHIFIFNNKFECFEMFYYIA